MNGQKRREKGELCVELMSDELGVGGSCGYHGVGALGLEKSYFSE